MTHIGARPLAAGIDAGPLPVAVIGSGFSGAMVAIHLAASLPPDRPVLIVESGAICRGPAYGTANAGHLLNVRASNMSAFPRQPDHFDRWLDSSEAASPSEVQVTDAGRFASRGLFGRYLSSLFNDTMAESGARVRLLRAEAVDLEPEDGQFRLTLADGSSRQVAAAVLAIGNLPAAGSDSPWCRSNPWAADALTGLRPDRPVLIMGTGLTMVDLALQLRRDGFSGPVIAVSRRGLLPQCHAPCQRWPTPVFTPAERESLPKLVARVRQEVRQAAALGVDWRGVIDSLRPVTADLWRGLPLAERRRFLRHVRPYWDIHRHRLAAPVAAQLAAMQESGFLTVRRARIVGTFYGAEGAEVCLRVRGAAEPERLVVQRVVDATGLRNAAGADSRLMVNLRKRGLARFDALQMGLDVSESLAVVAASGRAHPNLWALGPIVRGVFWECIAVPDIRVQAEQVARRAGSFIETAAAPQADGASAAGS